MKILSAVTARLTKTETAATVTLADVKKTFSKYVKTSAIKKEDGLLAFSFNAANQNVAKTTATHIFDELGGGKPVKYGKPMNGMEVMNVMLNNEPFTVGYDGGRNNVFWIIQFDKE